MILLELSHALALYSIVLGLLGIGIWVYTEFSMSRPQRHLGKQFLWRCVYCGFSYLDESAERVSQCPRCESYNSVEDENARQASLPTSGREANTNTEQDEAKTRNTSRRKRHHQKRRGPRRRR
ncbi:MAG: hypothetical protein QGG73_10885 [Candidatus Hydrogenedentes bacterium]|jgi:hypothetical protein|nr:hypothetical protein [Candidatus Hydrogenedentota bacterium]